MLQTTLPHSAFTDPRPTMIFRSPNHSPAASARRVGSPVGPVVIADQEALFAELLAMTYIDEKAQSTVLCLDPSHSDIVLRCSLPIEHLASDGLERVFDALNERARGTTTRMQPQPSLGRARNCSFDVGGGRARWRQI